MSIHYIMMEFDCLQKQYVEKRRNKSPVRNIKQSRYSFDEIYPQKIGKRNKTRRIFEKEKKYKEPKDYGPRLKMLFSWLKKTGIIGLLVLLCLMGINWNSFAWNNTEQEIRIPPLDPVSPLTKFASISYIDDPAINDIIFNITGNNEKDLPNLPSMENHTVTEIVKTFSYSIHEVKKNENATGIAQKYSIRIGTLIAYNNLQDASKLSIGQKLKIPNIDGIPYTIKQGDTISSIAEKNNININKILDVNDIIDDKLILAGNIIFLPGAKMNPDDLSRAIGIKPAKLMIRPVPGKITSNYGMREDPFKPGSGRRIFHRGIDYSGKIGEPVKAALNGTAQRRVDSVLGNHIIINHDGGYSTIYAHLSDYSVKSGEKVKQGQEIGKIGASGIATGSHLHFEVRLNGSNVNPQELLKN